MTDIEDRVQEIVREDPFLYEPLARGILNKSGAARWIKANRGIEGEEETIRSAIADLEKEDLASVTEVHPLLATARLEIRPDVGSIQLQRREGLKDQLLTFLESLRLENGEPFHPAVKEEEILLVVRDDRLEVAQEVFDSPILLDTNEELTAMTFYVEEPSGFGLLGIVLQVLSTEELDVIMVDGDATQATVIVPTSQQREALRTVDSFGVDAEP